MSKSLNQAFLKAYSKDKIRTQTRAAAVSPAVAEPHFVSPRAAANAEEQDPFIMRFDTATLPVPEPHLFSSPPQRPERVGARITPSLSEKAASLSRSASLPVQSAPSGNLSESLRDAIASQMLKAGQWDSMPIDTYSTSNSLGAIVPGGPKASASPLLQPPSENSEVFAETTPESAPLQPASKATTNNSMNVYPAASDQQVEVVPLDQRLAIHGLPGEIFRLDSPTYVREAVRLTSSDDASEDSGPQGSFSPPLPRERNLLNGGDEAVSPQPVSDSVSTARNPRGDHSKAIEENLRRARVRVFNPVWEVDSLQWPEVCLALLEKRAESMEKVAHNLISACQEGLQVLAVTSPQSGEGRTTVACCLAKLAGSRGLKVAIVDGDIENPSLSYQTNLDVEQDWKTAIFNQIPLEEIAVHSIDDQVTLVPLLRPIAHNEMSADDNRIAYMLYELAESFDLVVVDMGHMSSARSLVTTMGEQGILNAVVAVVDHRSSSPEQIETCLRRIRACGVASIGLVENFAA